MHFILSICFSYYFKTRIIFFRVTNGKDNQNQSINHQVKQIKLSICIACDKSETSGTNYALKRKLNMDVKIVETSIIC